MIDIYDLPAAWHISLQKVRVYFPGALIAGGALRDLDNGRPIKDIDIFAPNCTDLKMAKAFAEGLSNAPVKTLSSERRVNDEGRVYEEWAATDLLAIFDIQAEELDYQLIAIKGGPEDILKRIDFGICRIATDGEQIIRTDEYNADRVNECFTLHRCDDSSQYDRSLRRHERLVKKYVGWPLKIAPHLQGDCPNCIAFEGCFCAFTSPDAVFP